MKIKSVIAAVAACGAMFTSNAFAFADSENTEILLAAVPADRNLAQSAEADSADAKNNANPGVEGVAAVFGTLALAGAAVVISRKKV